ncbi:MAG: hypothetical protein M1834_009114 [Cirrosporium novae-zelandiae]|nr:MAG: hypothetical protein M1834_009114 [Cirrosporium novae-zelandiae]
MASQGDPPYLPEPFEDSTILELLDSISFPHPTSIQFMNVIAFYHLLYKLSFPSEVIASKLPLHARKPTGTTTELILRVAGEHIPKIKTENEAAVITWVRNNTKVPVPSIVHFDSSCSNALKCEYIILTLCPGQNLGDLCNSMGAPEIDSILDQIADILVELHQQPWTHIGGLHFSPAGDIVPGPLLEETFCYVTNSERYWGPEEHYEEISLVTGPFYTYVDYITAHLRKCIWYIHNRPKTLQPLLLPLIPRVKALLPILASKASSLNDVKLRLAHKDIHFANLLYDPSTQNLTGLVDWEFSGVVPFTKWNPVMSFPWNGRKTKKDFLRTRPLYGRFEERCKERGLDWLLQDAQFKSRDQEEMQKATDLLQTIIAMRIKGYKDIMPRMEGWLKDLELCLEYFGV